MTSTVRHTKGPRRRMGHVFTDLRIMNSVDQGMASRGLLDPGAVRSASLQEVLVDTGATYLALPADLIARLGLAVLRVVPVSTAVGLSQARVFRDVHLEVEGRSGTFDCLELPEGAQPLLGVAPLEVLGLEPDLKEQRLTLLPETGDKTHILLYRSQPG